MFSAANKDLFYLNKDLLLFDLYLIFHILCIHIAFILFGSIRDTYCKSIYSINQSINQSVHQSVSQSIN